MQETLNFYARPGSAAFHPDNGRYIGAIHDIAGPGEEDDRILAYREATRVPVKDPNAPRYKQLVQRDRALWPADEATARACGVEYVPVEFHVLDAARDLGEWIPETKRSGFKNSKADKVTE